MPRQKQLLNLIWKRNIPNRYDTTHRIVYFIHDTVLFFQKNLNKKTVLTQFSSMQKTGIYRK